MSGCIGVGREYRYPGARRYWWHKGHLGVPRDVGAIREHQGL